MNKYRTYTIAKFFDSLYRGDRYATRFLYGELKRDAYKIFIRWGGQTLSKEDFEDIFQETIESALKAAQSNQWADSNVCKFILENIIEWTLRYKRISLKTNNLHTQFIPIQKEYPLYSSSSEVFEGSNDNATVYLSDILNEEQTNLLVNRFVYDQSYSEIAEIQKINWRNLAVRAKVALNLLHKAISYPKTINFRKLPKEEVSCSFFTRKMIEVNKFFLMQVFIHQDHRKDNTEILAKEIDGMAAIRNGSHLIFLVDQGDLIDLVINIDHGSIFCEHREVIWNNRTEHIIFECRLPDEYDKDYILGDLNILVNKLEVGKIYFTLFVYRNTATNSNYGFIGEPKATFPLKKMKIRKPVTAKLKDDCIAIKSSIERLTCHYERGQIDLFIDFLKDIFKDKNQKLYYEVLTLKQRWVNNQQHFEFKKISYSEYTLEYNKMNCLMQEHLELASKLI